MKKNRQSAHAIGKLARIDVPTKARVLTTGEDSCEAETPYGHEKLSPISTFLTAQTLKRPYI
jgi:hypothetical protein